MEGKKSIPELSVDARILYDRLRKATTGEVIEYSELSALIGRDVRAVRYLLATAIKMAEREDAITFGAVHGIGIKRLDNAGILAVSESNIEAIGRKARRTDRKLGNCDYDSLAEVDKVRHNVMRAVVNAAAVAVSKKSQKKIMGVVEQTKQCLALNPTLEAMKR
jgi:hypothetical protein